MTNMVEAMRTPLKGYLNQIWGQPEYTSWIEEQMSWKQTCYIGDWSFLSDLLLKGPDALRLISDLSVNSFAKFDIGQAKHIVQCSEAGKVIAEGIVMRLGEEEFRCYSIPSHWTSYKLGKGRYNATAEHDSTFNFQVQGPNSLYVVEKAAGESIRDIGFMRFRKIRIGGREVMVLRQGMAGELGYELQGPTDYAQEIYDGTVKVGREFGIRRLGGRVFMTNHLEACFPTTGFDYLYAIYDDDGAEYREYLGIAYSGLGRGLSQRIAGSFESDDISAWYRSPVELGWKKNIKFDHDFIGRKALEAEVANPRRTMVTLVWNSDDVVDVYASLFRQGEPLQYMEIPTNNYGYMHADKVLRDGRLVGVTTSRGYSYYFRQMLSLGTIDVGHSKPGTEVMVVWGHPGARQRKIRATVAPAPYKMDNRRVDVTTLPPYLA